MSNLFGTDGIRDIAGRGLLTKDNVQRLGYAVVKWWNKHFATTPLIVIGADTRESGPDIVSWFSSTILETGGSCINTGVVTSPALYWYSHHVANAGLAVMITASHNPAEYNGIKIMVPGRGKLDPDEELEISNLFHQIKPTHDQSKQVGQKGESLLLNGECIETYSEHVAGMIGRMEGTTIVVDCANGSFSPMATELLSKIFPLKNFVIMSAAPDGTNINRECGSLHPDALLQAVQENCADFGIALDGDGDRTLVITKDGKIKDGDDLLAVLSRSNRYRNGRVVVGTVMSNYGVEKLFNDRGIRFIRAPVGDREVYREMSKQGAPLGAEPSGHIITADHVPLGDGIVAALSAIKIAIAEQDPLMNGLTKVPSKLVSKRVNHKQSLSKPPLSGIIDRYKKGLRNGRILVRYSGTEPVIRILVEHDSEGVASETATKLGNEIMQVLDRRGKQWEN